jgi:diguanylate cyclase (GGDEF)-like protein/PAS domain S-box-containing protein
VTADAPSGAAAICAGDPTVLDALQGVADALPVPFTATRADGVSVIVNGAYADLVGMPAEAIRRRPISEAVHPDDLADAARTVAELQPGAEVESEVRLRRGDGSYIRAVWRLRVDPGSGLVLAVVIDVSDERRAAERLAHESRHDALTGLANRLLVMHTLTRWVEEARTRGHAVGVALVDLDRFKLVNDRMGHLVGDHLLRAVATRLREVAPADALVGRMGGDEMIVLVPDTGPGGAQGLAAHLDRLQGDVEVLDVVLPLRASIGVVAGAHAPEQLLHEADVAAYTAKEAGGSRTIVFDDHLRQRDLDRRDLERRVAEVMAGDGPSVLFHPIRVAADGALRGVHALAVLPHPDGDLVVAGDVMAAVRVQGLAPELLDRKREAAARAMAAIPDQDLYLGLHTTDFSSHRGVDLVVDRAGRAGLDPARLVLQLTEATLLEDVDAAVTQLARARRRGVRVAIDRFGVGASSLHLLSSLPLDVLKVDGAFVDAAHRRSNARTILTGLVLMGPALGVTVVMDGVRTPEDLRLARRLGATLVQGPHVGAPVPVAELADHVRSEAAARW